jgi:hypothetical protein
MWQPIALTGVVGFTLEAMQGRYAWAAWTLWVTFCGMVLVFKKR